jgi:hypothetical protein
MVDCCSLRPPRLRIDREYQPKGGVDIKGLDRGIFSGRGLHLDKPLVRGGGMDYDSILVSYL